MHMKTKEYSFQYIQYIYNYIENKELSLNELCSHLRKICDDDMHLTEDELLILVSHGKYIGKIWNLNETISAYLLTLDLKGIYHYTGIEISGCIFSLFMLKKIVNKHHENWADLFESSIRIFARILPYLRRWDAVDIFLSCFDSESLYEFLKEEIEYADPEIEDIYLQTIRRINQNN